MAGAGIVLGILAVAAATSVYVYSTREEKKSTPGTAPMTTATCIEMLSALPKSSPTVAEGALRVGAQTAATTPAGVTPEAARKRIADAMADYLQANNYPTLANCLRQNPQIVDAMKAIPIPSTPPIPPVPPMTDADCAKAMSTLPPDIAKRIHDIASSLPPAQIAAAAAQAATLLDGLGYHEAANCVRRSPSLLLGDDKASLSVEACTAEIKALPSSVLVTIAASNPKGAEDVAHVLETEGYHRAADCVRNYPTLLNSSTFGIPGGIPSTIPGIPGELPIPPSSYLVLP